MSLRRHSQALTLVTVWVGIALAAPSLHAQQARFQGTVTDASGQPVAGATIHLDPGEGGGGVKAEATTRKKGDFILGLVRPGNYNIRIEAPGGLVVTAVKGNSTEIGRKEADWEVDKQVQPGTPITLEFKDGRLIQVDFVMGPPAPAGAQAPAAGGDPLGPAVEKVQAGDCAGALPEIEAVRASSPDNARAHYLAAFCLERAGNHEPALAAADRTLEVQPDFAGGSLLRGRVLRSLGRMEEAEAALKKEIETTPHETVRFDSWATLAVLYKDAGRTDDAIAAFEKITELQPTKGETYVELSALYNKKGDRAKAAQVLERAKQAGASADPAALLNVGIGYMNEQNYTAALEVFQKVIGTPDVPVADQAMAWGLVGRCQLNAGQTAEGAASLQKSLELDPAGAMAEENRQILAALQKK